jgi:3-methyladenine DNA glycosylase AlkD
MTYDEVIERLRAAANPTNVAGMARFGIQTERAYGISAPVLRAIAKEIGRDHSLAQQLWASGVHEGRLLAALVDDPKQVSEEQMEGWVRDFDSWDVCDNCCGHLFDKTPFAYRKTVEWSAREEEFVKRAGFALMAWLAVHDKKAGDEPFLDFLPIIKRESVDTRNYVKKAVNWALREIGKRNVTLNRAAIGAAEEIRDANPRGAQWVATDALRELMGESVKQKLSKKAG